MDSARLYTQYRRDRGEASLFEALRVALWATQYTFGVIDAPKVARKALESFRGREEAWLERSCAEWFPRYVLPELQQAGRRAVEQQPRRRRLVAIVTEPPATSPSPRRGAGHPARYLLGSRARRRRSLHVRIIEPLCTARQGRNADKVGQHEGFTPKRPFYSDSITDLPLLEVVKSPIVINPDRRLRRIAQMRGWPIEAW